MSFENPENKNNITPISESVEGGRRDDALDSEERIMLGTEKWTIQKVEKFIEEHQGIVGSRKEALTRADEIAKAIYVDNVDEVRMAIRKYFEEGEQEKAA